MNYKIGIDYGGTKIEGILINDKGEEILRKRSGYEKNYESGVDTIKNLVEAVSYTHLTLPTMELV